MTRPRSQSKLFEWHTQALEDIGLHLSPEVTDEVQCGWFKRRLVKGGIFIPARISMHQPIDQETGDLVGDEVFQCELAGHYADAETQWHWLCQTPITEAEYNYMVASIAWAKDNAPGEPMANPKDKVDWINVPVPQFTKEQTQ